MRSQKQIEASRKNGARSRGPKTPEGKARSARNSMRHGLLAACVVVDGEDPEAFRALLDQYLDRFHPVDDFEFGFVEEMAASYWRMRRCWAIETRLMSNAANARTSGDNIDRIAAAFSSLATSPDFALLSRYETRLHRMFQRALKNLLKLRAERLPNEPEPDRDPTPALASVPAPSPAEPAAPSPVLAPDAPPALAAQGPAAGEKADFRTNPAPLDRGRAPVVSQPASPARRPAPLPVPAGVS